MIEVFSLALSALLLGVAIAFRDDLPSWATAVLFLASVATLLALFVP